MSDLLRGVQQEPNVICGYGVPGIGKSTFAAGSENPLFVGPERNGSLNVAKLTRSLSHDQLCQQIRDVAKGKYDKENFRNLVLDSIDMHEKVIHDDITKKEPGSTMATAMKGFGKAYNFAGSKLYEIKNLLDDVRTKKEMGLVILGHSIVTPFNDPMLASNYEVYEMCLHKTKRVDYNSIFTDWADMVLFFNWKAFKTEDGNHAVSLGKREILTEFRPSHLAKNRFNLPYSIEMSQNPLDTFKVLQGHIDAFYASGNQANTAQNDFNILVHECKMLMGDLNDEMIKPQIEQAINAECVSQNFNNLLIVRDRIKEMVANQ